MIDKLTMIPGCFNRGGFERFACLTAKAAAVAATRNPTRTSMKSSYLESPYPCINFSLPVQAIGNQQETEGGTISPRRQDEIIVWCLFFIGILVNPSYTGWNEGAPPVHVAAFLCSYLLHKYIEYFQFFHARKRNIIRQNQEGALSLF